MGRFHALEWEDLEWFPSAWRDYGTDYLQFIANKFDIYKSAVPIIARGLAASGSAEWVDCASGGGGGLLRLAEHLRETHTDLKITVTDFYPNRKAFERLQAQAPETFVYEEASVDARAVPAHLVGKFRTMFASFHHFRPKDAQAILQNAVDTRTPIAIFEPLSRSPLSWISMLFVPLNVLILTPFIRPVRWGVLPFIYLLPLVLLYIWWDGIASILRMYSKRERQNLVRQLQNSDSFDWEIGQTAGAAPVHYLLGLPKSDAARNT